MYRVEWDPSSRRGQLFKNGQLQGVVLWRSEQTPGNDYLGILDPITGRVRVAHIEDLEWIDLSETKEEPE